MKIFTIIINCKRIAFAFLALLFFTLPFVSKAQNKVTGVSVSAQTGTLTYGTSANATYTITLVTDGGSPDNSSDLSLNWSSTTPTGIIVSYFPSSSVILPSGSVSQNVTLTLASDGSTYAGSYDFTISTTNDPQTSNSTSLIENQAPLTIKASDQSKMYGTAVSTTGVLNTTFTVTGLQNSDALSSVALGYSGTPSGDQSTANVGSYIINPSSPVFSTGSVSNYIITYTSGNLIVSPAALTITANNGTKVYGTVYTTGAGSTAFTSTGLQNAETIGSITIASTGAPANASVAGSPYIILPSAATGGTFNPSNYTITYTNGSLAITSAVLTATAAGVNKVYNGTTAATVTFTDNRVAGDVLTVNYTTATFSDKNVGTGKTVSVSGISISGADAANYTVNTTAATTANITGKVLTVTATGINKVYDGTTAATVTLSDNRTAGDNITAAYTTATFATKNVGTGKAVSVSGISISGPDAGNYTYNTTATATANITARPLTATAAGVNKVYDGTTAATVTFTDNRVAGDVLTVNYTTATFSDKNVGTGKTVSVSGISISGPDAGNYTYNTTATATANITVRPLTATAAGVNKVYNGTTAATVTFTDNRVAGDVLTVNYTTATFSDKNVGTGKTVSVSGISISGADAANYTVNTTAATTANITGKVLTVTATGINKVYDGTTAATVTLSDNRTAGDNITAAYTTATFATKNVGTGKAVSVSGISISGPDAGNYTYNTTATATANITARPLTATAAGVNKVYDGTTAATVTFTDNRVAGDVLTVNYTTATFSDKNVGTGKTVSVSGISISGADAANYTVNTTAATTANITGKVLTVTATGINKVYDGTTAATVTLSDNRTAGDNITAAYTTATFATKNVGTGKAVSVSGISISGPDAGNYTYNTTATATANITARPLTATAAGVNKVYNGTTAATVTFTDNRVAGDVLTVNYTTATFSDKNVGTGKTVSVSGISISGADAANYTVNTTAATTANITPAALTITANDGSKSYGTIYTTGAGSTAFTSTVLQNGETIGSITISSTGAPAAAALGTYPIVPSAATGGTFNAANYSITYTNGTLTVTQATPSIAVISNNNASCINSSVTFTATITSSPNVTGSVQFFDGATSLAVVAVSANVATYTTSALSAGSHSITAKYLGDVNFVSVTSTVLAQVVNNPPIVTGYTICQGLAVLAGQGLTSTASCAIGTPGTASRLPSTTGNTSNGATWANTGNISAIDGVYSTTATMTGGNDSKYLYGLNYGFSIPANATINGVTVAVKALESGGTVQDESVVLIVGNTLTGNDYAYGNTLSTSASVVSYGSATDTWGLTLTPAQINASNFGVAYAVINNAGGSRTASVDYIQITVSYTIPGTLNWYTAASGGTLIGNGSPFNPVGASGSGLANTNTPGTYQFFAECTSAQPGCRSEADFVINPTPTITGTAAICAGSTTQLTGSGTPATTNPWTSSATGVATVSSTGLVTATATGGTTTITYTNNNGCQATVVVTVRPTPTATIATSATQACQNATSPTVTISNPRAFPVTVTYTINGVTQPTINIAANSSAVATSQGTGTVTSYTYQLVSIVYQTAPTCGNGISGSVTYTVNPLPTVTGTTPNSRCGTGTVTIGATASTGATIDWYANATGGAVLAGGTGTTSYTTPSISSTTTYYAQARSTTTGCVSALRTTVIATINPNPTVFNVTGGGTYCIGGSGLPVGLSGSQTGVNYTLTPGAIVVAGTGAAISFGNQTAAGTYTVSAANTTTGCTSAMNGSATIIISNPIITSVTATPFPNLCLGNPDTLKALPVGSNILSSEDFEGPSTFTVTNTGNVRGIWTLRNSPYTYTGDASIFNDGSNFMIAIADSAGLNTTNTILTSPTVNTTGYTSLTLTFNMYFRYYGGLGGDDVFLEVSTNGGTTWTTAVDYSSTQGSTTAFASETANLNSYINNANFKFRLRYNSFNGYYVAVDNFVLTGSNPNKYSWASTAGGGLPASAATPSIANSTVIALPTVTGSITYTATLIDGASCTAPTKSVTINVIPAPSITIQPVNKEGCVGDTLNFSAIATGVGQTYRWYKNGVALTDGAHYSGSGTATLTINSLINSDQDNYYLIVTNSNGCSVTSNTVTLTVDQPITITQQPINQTVCAGTNVTFSVAATGGTFMYQWRIGNTPLTDGGNIAGSSTPTLTITGVTSANAAPDYNVVITGNCVAPEVSNYVYLVVNNAAITPTTQASFVLFPTVNPTSVTVSFNPSPSATNYLIIVKSTAGAPANPVDGTTYTVGTGTLAAGRVDYVGTNTYVTSNGLSPNTNYCYYIYAFNKGVCGAVTRYKTPPLNGCVTTGTVNSCGTPIAALYWAGKASIITGSTTGTDFNTASNWSTSSSSYTASPSVPGGCNDVYIQLKNDTKITLSANSATNNLTFTMQGNNVGQGYLSMEGKTLVINGDALIDVISGFGDVYIGENNPATKGYLDFEANANIGPSNGNGTADLLGHVGTKITFKGDLVLGKGAAMAGGGGGTNIATKATSTPDTVEFDGPGLQQVTWNNNVYYDNFINVVIGNKNNPVVRHVTGTFVPDNILNSLTINGSSVVDLALSQWNRATAGGIFKMNGTSRLVLSNDKSITDGGQGGQYMSGSNFPGGFTTMTFSPTSTIEYAGADNITQTVYAPGASLVYCNLELSNNNNLNTASKISTAVITVADSLLVDTTVKFTPAANVISNGKTFVKAGGTLVLGPTYAVTGSGQFNLNANGNLWIGNALGITASSVNGNVQTTGGRNFSTGGNYTYYGTGALVTGDGLPFAMNNLTINNSTSITMNPANRNYNVTGTLIQTAGPLIINGDTLTVNRLTRNNGTFTGSSTSSIGVSGNNVPLYFTGKTGVLKNLYLTANASASIGTTNTLAIVGGTSFGSVSVATGATFSTFDSLTLKSNYYGTARVGISYGAITGKVMVERNIPPRRAWRFLSAPVNSTQTINKAWQEGATNPSLTTRINPRPGYGTQITYDNLTAHGFDVNTTSNPSIRTWTQSTQTWSLASPFTNSTTVSSYPAYCLFVRGSRAVDLSLATYAPTDTTTLRTYGTLNETGASSNSVAKALSGTSGDLVFVGNPYASSINLLTTLGNSGGVNQTKFYVWDPKLNGPGNFNVGGYVTYSGGVWTPSGAGSYMAGVVPNIIQSGQAFMVQLSGASGSVNFQQTDKNLTQSNVFGLTGQQPPIQQKPTVVYTNLMVPQGDSLVLADGVAAAFGDGYSAKVDDLDAKKLMNFDENIALFRDQQKLAIEFRPVPMFMDTLFFKLYLRQEPYVLKVFTQNTDANAIMQGWLVDKYLKTETALNLYDTMLYKFAPNTDTNSYRNRFMIIFKRIRVATPNDTAKPQIPVASVNSNESSVAATEKSGIDIYPNPVATGERIMLKYNRMKKGKYQVAINNISGALLSSWVLEHSGGSNTYSIKLNSNLSTGNYIIKITGDDGTSTTTKLIIGK